MKSREIKLRKEQRLMVAGLLVLALMVIPFQSSSYAYVQFSDAGTGAAAGTFVFEHWPAVPISYVVDNGPAPGGFTEATLVTPAFDTWENVATSSVDFNRQANMSGDDNWTNDDFGITWGMATDNNFEIVFDDNGDWLGNNPNLLGIGLTTVDTTNGNIVDAVLVLNNNTNGTSDFLATMVHEVGHTIGLGHTNVGNRDAMTQLRMDRIARPTMFPFAFPNNETHGRTLEPDDISSVSRIYPETVDNAPNQIPWRQGRGAINGYVFKGNNGSFARGVHVRAVNMADPNIQLACLSDYKGEGTGEFLIEGLPPGDYNVIMEGIDGRNNIFPGNIEDDGIGGPGNAYAGFADDFFADPESNGEPTANTVTVRVYPEWTTSGVYLVTNEGSAADLAIRPWGVEDHPIHEPWWSSSDIYVDNDGDGIHNESGEPALGNPNNQLFAVVRNIGNLRSARYRVVFSFSPINSAGEAMPQQIASVDMDALDPGASVTVGPVSWDLSTAGLSAFPPEFRMTNHFCVKAWVVNRDNDGPLVDADQLNNLARSNFDVVSTGPSGGLTTFFAVNTEAKEAVARLMVTGLPKGWRMVIDDVEVTKEAALGLVTPDFILQPHQLKLVRMEVYPSSDFFDPAAPGQQGVQISQFLNGRVVGGLTANFIDPAKFPPFALSSLTLSPATVAGGCNTSTGKVTLNAAAPAGGAVVKVTNTNPAASMPATVTIPAGATSQSFTIATSAVAATKTGTVTASLNTVSRSATLSVRPIGVQSVALSPNPVLGGNNVTGTVTLECAAAPGNITVTLASSNPAVAKPTVASIVVPAGARTMNFTVATARVGAVSTATISATANAIAKSRSLTVNP